MQISTTNRPPFVASGMDGYSQDPDSHKPWRISGFREKYKPFRKIVGQVLKGQAQNCPVTLPFHHKYTPKTNKSCVYIKTCTHVHNYIVLKRQKAEIIQISI